VVRARLGRRHAGGGRGRYEGACERPRPVPGWPRRPAPRPTAPGLPRLCVPSGPPPVPAVTLGTWTGPRPQEGGTGRVRGRRLRCGGRGKPRAEHKAAAVQPRQLIAAAVLRKTGPARTVDAASVHLAASARRRFTA